MLSDQADETPKTSVAKKVEENVGKLTTDEQGDKHMIVSNDLLVRDCAQSSWIHEEAAGSSDRQDGHWEWYCL